MSSLVVNHPTSSSAITPAIAQRLRCLLIVWRCPEHLQRLRSSLDQLGVRTTYCASPFEVCEACEQAYDLAIVDVEPKFLVGILTTLRASAACAEVSVWVENSRLYEASQLAGVLPRFRAMPCNIYELTKLIHLRLASDVKSHQSHFLNL